MKITRPTLLLDEARCRANINRMAVRAKKGGVTFRPHFKTHQSEVVGNWIREEGVNACTVSSIRMARYFADAGWTDITVAFPMNVLEIEEINRLASTIRLHLLAVDADTIRLLAPLLTSQIGIFIEVDTGYRRTGVTPDDHSRIQMILDAIASGGHMKFSGFLTHAGNSYSSRSAVELLQVHRQTTLMMQKLGDRYRAASPDLVVSVGDTPTCSVATLFDGVNEIRPGNFVFYDWMQCGIGSCRPQDVAIAMACPVVAVYPARNEVVVHGGAVHFSKDSVRRTDGLPSFGQVISGDLTSWGEPTGAYLKSLSQEHGILQVPSNEIGSYRAGQVALILPVHSCLTADVMGSYITTRGHRISMMPRLDPGH